MMTSLKIVPDDRANRSPSVPARRESVTKSLERIKAFFPPHFAASPITNVPSNALTLDSDLRQQLRSLATVRPLWRRLSEGPLDDHRATTNVTSSTS
ncbi:MAG: hypothetical protein ACKV2Q_29490 [Planctomycetaceae bacterium]